MLQLLKVEWMKVKNYTTFWVLSILYLVSVFGAIYIFYLGYQNRPPDKGGMSQMILGNPFNFPDIWHVVSYGASFLMFMLGLLIIISVTNEYSYKTHRQNIIDGWSRSEFILVKILLTIIISFVATIAVFITALLFGLVEGGDFSFEKVEYVGYFFIQALNYSSIALLISLVFKRSGIAIGVYFLYSTIIENVLAGLLNRYADNFGRYLPLETTDNLIRIPVFKVIVNQLLASYNTTALLTMSFAYLALYYFLSVRKFQTDDL
jgi:hypothetical protein